MTTTDTTPITLPRLPDESARAYAARVEYVTMGPGRSIDKVGQKIGMRSVRYLEQWSAAYGWKDSARQYDEQVAYLTVQQAAQQYRADLDEHRQRYGQTGRELHTLARSYMRKLAVAIQELDGRTIKPSRLALDVRTVSSALTVAADLEAHALRLADLMPKLSAEEDSDV